MVRGRADIPRSRCTGLTSRLNRPARPMDKGALRLLAGLARSGFTRSRRA